MLVRFSSFLKNILCFAGQREQTHLQNNNLPPKKSHEISMVESGFLQVLLPERHETALKIWCSSEGTCSWGCTVRNAHLLIKLKKDKDIEARQFINVNELAEPGASH